jgi:hypothetical protein
VKLPSSEYQVPLTVVAEMEVGVSVNSSRGSVVKKIPFIVSFWKKRVCVEVKSKTPLIDAGVRSIGAFVTDAPSNTQEVDCDCCWTDSVPLMVPVALGVPRLR